MSGCRLKKLSKSFRVDGRIINALDEIDLSIDTGDFISIVGYSGCGKSTLLKTIIGLLEPDSGYLEFRGMEGRTSIVFQEPRLISSKGVEKNLLLALKHQKDPSVKEKVLNEVLGILGLTAFRKALPYQLSGGMAQRVALGRALCRQPELLLMDEPFGALDAFNRSRLQRKLIQIYQKRNVTILFVTHDISEAILLGNKIIVMSAGKIVRSIEVPLARPRNKTSADFISIQNELLTTFVEQREPQYIS